MSLSMYDLSVPPMVRAFGVLSAYLDKAAAFAQETGTSPQALLTARLAPDMLTLTGQIQRASDKSKNGVARLTLVEAPPFADDEASFEELKARIAKTSDFLQSIDKSRFEDSARRVIDLKFRSIGGKFHGETYLTGILLPDFYFHVSTAHAILRHNGVQIGKLDYLGSIRPDAQ